MNRLIDLIKTWSYKLSYRIMRISGASDEALNRYLVMVGQQKESDAAADEELAPHHKRARLIIFALGAVAAWLLYRFLKKKRIIK